MNRLLRFDPKTKSRPPIPIHQFSLLPQGDGPPLRPMARGGEGRISFHFPALEAKQLGLGTNACVHWLPLPVCTFVSFEYLCVRGKGGETGIGLHFRGLLFSFPLPPLPLLPPTQSELGQYLYPHPPNGGGEPQQPLGERDRRERHSTLTFPLKKKGGGRKKRSKEEEEEEEPLVHFHPLVGRRRAFSSFSVASSTSCDLSPLSSGLREGWPLVKGGKS